MTRKTDNDDKHYFQMDRFYQTNGEWYYTTREGDEIGPFTSKEEAEAETATYIRDKVKTDKIGE